MKKICLIFSISLLTMGSLFAQDYRPFGVNLGLGYAAPANGGGGILVDIEPFYRANDIIAIGLRLETAAMAKVIDGSNDDDFDVSAVGSYTLNGRYYLMEGGFRPYVGLGLGLYSLGKVSVKGGNTDSEVSVGNKFGFYPRVGFDAGHFNFNIDYNIVGKTDGVEINNTIVKTGKSDIKNSYIGFRIGAFIGGGTH